jgi:hypothetical protein
MNFPLHPRIINFKEYKGYKIVFVKSSVTRDYGAMNHWAAIKLGFIPIPGKFVIFVEEGMSELITKQTIFHEYVEAELMRQNPMMGYFEAHKIALELEKRIK